MIARLIRLAAFAATLALAHGAALALPVVPGEHALGAKAAAPAPRLRLDAAAPAPRVQLAPPAASEIEKVRRANARTSATKPVRRVAIGMVRALPRGAITSSSEHHWIATAGGSAARVVVASPGAEALRVAIELAGIPEDVEMVFFGSAGPSRLEGPVRVGDVRDRTAPWWSPLTEGDSQTVEFFVPRRHDPRALGLRVLYASHLLTAPSSRFTKRAADIGLAGSCNVDVPCSQLNASPEFQDVVDSVAQMVFNDNGLTILCTGSLLNDTDAATQIPWFFSANHCLDNERAPFKSAAQMQSVANTLATLWFFEANACGSRTPDSNWQQLGGGATFIHNVVVHDAVLLRLDATPPKGAFYSGWDPNPISMGTAVVGIHHPQGDLKKVAQGSMLAFSTPNVAASGGSFFEIRWSSGTTESGSSGSGVWTPSGSQYLFRGGLWGGTALCSNPGGTDHYSRFDLLFPELAPFLSPKASPFANFTDLWWNPNESGWGLNLIQHPSGNVFGVWYTFEADGTRTWYVIPGGSWTSTNTYAGAVYATAGPAASQSFDASNVRVGAVGSATLTFSDATNGTFAFTVNGVSGAKSIQRQPF